MTFISDFPDGIFRLIEKKSDNLFYASCDGGATWSLLKGMTDQENARLSELEDSSVKNIFLNETQLEKTDHSIHISIGTRDLSDVSGDIPSDGQILRWNSVHSRYEPGTAAVPSSGDGGGGLTLNFGSYGGENMLNFGIYN